MNYKLSNIASKTSLELLFGLPLRYPNIYRSNLVIDGLKEQSIPIISMEDPDYITEGIWGILPQDFKGDWEKFQKLKTTLHTNKNDIDNNILYNEALEKRRCLILVTGFYMYELVDNEVKTYLIEKENATPFALAGIYNILEDGFATCSVINTRINDLLSSEKNLYDHMPLEIPLLFKKMWLSEQTPLAAVQQIISKPYLTKFKIQRIAS
ncbi:SOS response-associated peptidase family protein [Kordia sp.]|uniref:SOS response-associated peptidase family protein n=1 Tax=Kordia sp. TaxID=1965332 RepID=UPI003D28E8C1